MTKIYLLESEKIPLPKSLLKVLNQILRTEEFDRYSHEKRKEIMGGVLGKTKAFTKLTGLLEYVHLPKDKYYHKINRTLNKGLSYHHKGWIITKIPIYRK